MAVGGHPGPGLMTHLRTLRPHHLELAIFQCRLGIPNENVTKPRLESFQNTSFNVFQIVPQHFCQKWDLNHSYSTYSTSITHNFPHQHPLMRLVLWWALPVCPCARGSGLCPCARVPVDRVVPVCLYARGSGCARVPVCLGQRQVQKSRSDMLAGSCSLAFNSPNSLSTLRGSYGRCKGRCLIWVLLTLACGVLPVNFRMVRLLWHVEMHFDCPGSRKVYVCVLASSAFLLKILLLNINIFLLNINIIIFLSLDTNFNQLRGTQRKFQLGMFDW